MQQRGLILVGLSKGTKVTTLRSGRQEFDEVIESRTIAGEFSSILCEL